MRTRIALALVCSVMTLGLLPATAAAWDPSPTGQPISIPTSLTYDPAIVVQDPAVVAAKAADFAAFTSRQQFQAATPLVPSAVTLVMNKYHQKTTSYCLAASNQTILDTKFGGYATPSVKAGQDAIYACTGTNAETGRQCMNTELQKHARTPSDWLYTNINVTSSSSLWNYILYDVGTYSWPTFVRVNWDSPYWPDHNTGTTVVGHASDAIGYDSPSSAVKVYDPWTYVQTDGTCYVGPGYSSSADRACHFTLTLQNYWNATLGPEWY